MNKEIISSRQGIVLVILFMFGSTLVIGTGGEAKKDMWLAMILGIVIAAPILIMYTEILSMFPGNDIFDILKIVFGNVAGKVISLFFIWFALHLGGLVMFNFNEYISTVGLDQTPKIVFAGSSILLCVWGVKEGIEVLGRWGEILLPFLIFIIFASLTLSIPNLKLKYILPILEEGIKPVMKGAFSVVSFPLAETVIFTMIFSCMKNKKSIFKAYILGLLITGTVFVIVALRNTMVLGSYIISMSYYASFLAVARINIGHFLQRLESAVSIVFLISGFLKICMCLLGASKGISKLFSYKDYRFIVIPTALIILNLSFLVSKDVMELTKWTMDIYPYYSAVVEIILPSFIFVCAKVRYKKIHDVKIK